MNSINDMNKTIIYVKSRRLGVNKVSQDGYYSYNAMKEDKERFFQEGITLIQREIINLNNEINTINEDIITNQKELIDNAHISDPKKKEIDKTIRCISNEKHNIEGKIYSLEEIIRTPDKNKGDIIDYALNFYNIDYFPVDLFITEAEFSFQHEGVM